MSLGLPSHLSRVANSRALAAGARWAGFVCLGAALVNVVATSVGARDPYAWLAILALAPMIALLAFLGRRRTVALTVAYLLVGTVCTYFYVLALLGATPSYHDTNLFVIALPIVAMTLVGGTGTGAFAGILWATAGFALAEFAVMFAAATAGRVFRTDAISLGAYLLLVGVLTFDGLTRGTRSRTQSAIHRSVRDLRLIELRRDLIADSTAQLHDTVLSELLAVANAEPGPLPHRLRTRIEADLRSLGQDRGAVVNASPGGAAEETADARPDDRMLGADAPAAAGATGTPGAPGATGTPGQAWFDSELLEAIELARDEGLAVDLSGDRDALGRLGPERRRAVGLAARQCLVNVLRHSGSPTAEVAISASDDAVTVMVVDAGRGFVPSSTASDRLGLRQSVNDRIERVGGTVTIFSSPDVGTTVMLIVPVGDVDSEFAT